MRRREFITLFGGAAAALPLAARAQQAEKTARIGLMTISFSTPLSSAGVKLFVSELRPLGFVEGKNIIIERRELGFGRIGNDKLFADAAELAQSKVDVMVAVGSEVFVQA